MHALVNTKYLMGHKVALQVWRKSAIELGKMPDLLQNFMWMRFVVGLFFSSCYLKDKSEQK